MEKFDMNHPEAFDIDSTEEMRKRQGKKVFIIVLISSIVVMIVVLAGLFYMYELSERNKPIEAVNEVIVASGEALYEKQVEIAERQSEAVKYKSEYMKVFDCIIANQYIKNNTYVVYTDGTYLSITQESIGIRYRENITIGTIDLSLIDKFVADNTEKLNELGDINYLNGDDDFVEPNNAMILVGKNYKLATKNEDESYDQMLSLFFASKKEVIQNYDITKETDR